jgi:hypothetical protein
LRNILWHALGDYKPLAGSTKSLRQRDALIAIKAAAPWSLFGGEGIGPVGLTTDATDFAPYVHSNSIYANGTPTNCTGTWASSHFCGRGWQPANKAWDYVTKGGATTGTGWVPSGKFMPVWNGESAYVSRMNGDDKTQRFARHTLWWATLAGAIAGENNGDDGPPCSTSPKNCMATWNFKSGTQTRRENQYSFERKWQFGFWSRLPWYNFKPEGTSSTRTGGLLIPSGGVLKSGTTWISNPTDPASADGDYHIGAAGTSDKKYAVVYTYKARSFKFNMPWMSSTYASYKARWFNPTTGLLHSPLTVSRSAIYTFTTPTSSGASSPSCNGDAEILSGSWQTNTGTKCSTDWVLVIEPT